MTIVEVVQCLRKYLFETLKPRSAVLQQKCCSRFARDPTMNWWDFARIKITSDNWGLP